MKTRYKRTVVLGLLFAIFCGLGVYLLTGIILQFHQSSFAVDLTPLEAITHILPPTAINIPKLNKNLPIKIASVSGNTWDMFPNAVAWLNTSSVPGKGNVILYAHNWKSLWRDLYLLKPGDPIEIQQGDIWKKYTVVESKDIDANDIQAVLSENNQLTLYTCEGTFDQKRRVIYASPLP